VTDRDRPTFSDDRLDEMVRAAALAGPPAGEDASPGLPVLTRVLLGLGVVAAASVAVALTLTVFLPANQSVPLQVAQADEPTLPVAEPFEATIADPGDQSDEAPAVSDGIAEAAADPVIRPAASLVIARFSPEESDRLAALFFPVDAQTEETMAQVPVEPADEDEGLSNRDHLLAIGRALRSADVARDALALMSPEEQLEACRLWSAEPSLRPIAFAHLSHLSMDPAVASDARRVAEALAIDASNRPWLASYGLTVFDAQNELQLEGDS